ncbi:MAG: nodulation protein NfeD [Candidatus Kapabacteria bacterium]|nr:nodulation protein NfeD [Ignavibacteriota bacterium]MCW5886069.1 nodulation protein NfeD [Candidatus Kapabacteria bacterium]
MRALKYILIFFCMSIIAESNTVTVITINSGIGPATAMYIRNGLDEAIDIKSNALIIKLNTPGGLLESTRDIASYLLDSEIPVIVYVAPGGARAGSAGVFITLAGHIAVMAPGTNIGAAHPVGLGGTSDSTVMGQKVENDAAAFVRTIAQKRNKNADWAERAVRESISSTENEAFEEGVIDYIAKDINDLVRLCDSHPINIDDKEFLLDIKDAEIIYRDMNWKESLLAFISNPNIAYILILVGVYGLFFEIKSPGTIVPGTVGGISILLAAYSLQMMPINYVGLALMVLGIVLFIIEIFVTSYGVLTIGGIISFTIGSIMLIDSPFEFMRISMGLIITAVVITTALFAVIVIFAVKAQKERKVTGEHTIIGDVGVAKTLIEPGLRGKVLIQGELWQAISEDTIQVNEKVTAIAVKSMTITVKKA